MTLLDEYPGDWSFGLIPLCGLGPHTHCGRPCESLGKTPVVGGWQRAPSERMLRGVEPDKIARQMGEHLARGGNIGLVIPPGAAALDADTSETATVLDRVLGDSPRQQTGRGAHFVVRLPKGLIIQNGTKIDLEPGLQVDVRTQGGQIVCAPSIHAATRLIYTWERSLPECLEDLPLLPERWVARFARRPRASQHPSNGDRIPEGIRNSTLYALCRSLRCKGLLRESIWAALLVENQKRCDPPLGEDELARVVESAFKQADRPDFHLRPPPSEMRRPHVR